MSGKKKNFYAYPEAEVAVHALAIKSQPEYMRRHREDPRLPAKPDSVYASDGWKDWYNFLGKQRPTFYPIYDDAKTAVQAMGIKTQSDYSKRYREDPKLPSSPDTIYADAGWTDWYEFLGNKQPVFYPSYTEAKVAAQALAIKKFDEYGKRYREDPRLPSNPNRVYAGVGWTHWYDFLGNKRPDYYPSYAEALEATRVLAIQKYPEYLKRSREDPRLPINPARVYDGAGWTDWYDFLGYERPVYYLTYAEAQTAVQSLTIHTHLEYRDRRGEDPKLPPNPHVSYAEAGWVDWYDFLGNALPDLYPTYAQAKAAAQVLGIKTKREYRKLIRLDMSLPAAPFLFYANAGWTDWYEYLGNERPDLYPTYAEAQAAVQALAIKTLPEYKKRYCEDTRLPATPSSFYSGAGWTDWYDFVNKERPDLYPTYAEAQAAARALAIQKHPEYVKRYREDFRLPSNPHIIYAGAGWTNWYDFLGNEQPDLYPTYLEAQEAAQSLAIQTSSDYIKRYREDPRLTSGPERIYSDIGWTDWYDFLGNERPDFYPTYAEAKAAAQLLSIISQSDYKKRYREDQRLPSSPEFCYAVTGWKDWYDFLGNEQPDWYKTLTEAQAATQALKITKQSEYRQRYCEDMKLPADPSRFYAGIGWTDWYDFLGTENPYAVVDCYPLIWGDVERWLKTQTSIAAKKSGIRVFLAGYCQPQGLPDNSTFLLLRANSFNTVAYQQFIESQAESMKRPFHSAVTAFFSWVLNEYCTDTDADERVVLPGYRNPFKTVLAGYTDSLQAYRPTQSTKPPLGYEYILRARDYLVPNGEQVLQIRPNLKDLPHLQVVFDSRADWIYVNESMIDRDDPNCIWRKVEKADRRIDGKRELVDSYQIWTPVRFIALYTLLRFPLRGQQILWLDSGEADNEIAVFDTENGGVCWKKNTGHLAGKGSKKRRPQAVVQRGDKDAPKIYVTTNKTGRSEGGYEVEWIPDDLVYWFLFLRDWQAKYNPLSEPTSWTDISLRAETNEKILQARGTQCFLFRTDTSGQPAFTTTAFTHTLPMLLFRIQRPGEHLASEDLDRKANSNRYSSPYTPHSLRVSLITAFIADGKAQIHLISKLVGHASLVMTIYYTKLSNAQMRSAIGDAEKRAGRVATERDAEIIRTQGFKPLRHQLIATDGNRFLIESDVTASACVVFDCGICPMSAAACHIGGEAVAERKVENIYAPVEAGYLGQKNCPRCRFFVTGVPFLGGLVSLANEIALEIHTESARFQGFSEEVERLGQVFYDACQQNHSDTEWSKRKEMNANQQQSAAKLDGLLNDYIAVNHYVKSCVKLINESEQSSDTVNCVRLVVAGDFAADVSLSIEESETNYHLLAEICQNASIYQSVNSSRAVPLISQHIDRMAENNNLAPAMFRLSDKQKLVVINELNQLLLQRLGSWEKIDHLFSGDLMLLDLDVDSPELSLISNEISQLLSNPNRIRKLTNEDCGNA